MVSNTYDDTGAWLKAHADIEHDAENGVSIQYHNGQWIVGGVVIVDTIDSALELALDAA